jgi:hypothetical protein
VVSMNLPQWITLVSVIIAATFGIMTLARR